MHPIVIDVTVDPNREEEATRTLRDMIVPKARALAGFVAGYLLRAQQDTLLRSVHFYDSQDAAHAAATAIQA